MIGKVCNEEKVSDDVVITVESGIMVVFRPAELTSELARI